jgi:hypothetical protein
VRPYSKSGRDGTSSRGRTRKPPGSTGCIVS